MEWLVLIASALALAAFGGFVLKRRRQQIFSPQSAAVSRQHLYLFQGGRLSESELESAKANFQRLLKRGEVGRIESGLRAGTRFAVEVRALAELGSPEAGAILQRQLQRRFSPDPVEQSWYRLDLAHSLRMLSRPESLPMLLQSFPAEETPLRHYLAAETACFPGFEFYLSEPETAAGQAALRVLHQTLVGLRGGVQPHVVAGGRLGEAVETVWRQRHATIEPVAVCVLAEALRLLNRAGHIEREFGEDRRERERFRRQIRLIAQIAEPISEFLGEVPPALLDRLSCGNGVEERNLLQALIDLKADTSSVVCPLLETNRLSARELAIESLACSADPKIGPWLCAQMRRAKRSRPSVPSVRALLKVLRHFPSEEAEALLLRGARDWRIEIRAAAIGGLGWWEPIRRAEVVTCLRKARQVRQADVRRAAEAALARLGERAALAWFRQQLAGENSNPIHHAIQLAADEGVLLLWPDLDRLADAEDPDVARHACEALEQLRESCTFSGSVR